MKCLVVGKCSNICSTVHWDAAGMYTSPTLYDASLLPVIDQLSLCYSSFFRIRSSEHISIVSQRGPVLTFIYIVEHSLSVLSLLYPSLFLSLIAKLALILIWFLILLLYTFSRYCLLLPNPDFKFGSHLWIFLH